MGRFIVHIGVISGVIVDADATGVGGTFCCFHVMDIILLLALVLALLLCGRDGRPCRKKKKQNKSRGTTQVLPLFASVFVFETSTRYYFRCLFYRLS